MIYRVTGANIVCIAEFIVRQCGVGGKPLESIVAVVMLDEKAGIARIFRFVIRFLSVLDSQCSSALLLYAFE